MDHHFLIHQSIIAAANRKPDQTAFRSGNKSVSYAELVQKSRQIAHLLQGAGVQKGDRVGIYLNRSLESAIAVYGVLTAGAAFVPLDPTAPHERTRFLLKDCGIQHLISQAAQGRKLEELLSVPHALQSLIGVEAEWNHSPQLQMHSWESVWQASNQVEDVHLMEHDLAYIMYTSGSTGQPKGIMHTHHSGLSYAKMSAALYDLRPEDVVANHAPLHFDISTFGYLTVPLVGSTTVILPDAYTKLPASLSQLMEKENISFWYSVPLALIQLLTHGVLDKRDLSALRWVLFGGEPFPVKHLRALMEQWPHARFCNVYGPAEINQCTYFHLPAFPEEGSSVPLGSLCSNAEMRIVNPSDQEVGIGETGELLVRTSTMMQGYWNQPDLTAKGMYIEEPYPGFKKVFYRTGDLVQLDEAGNLLFFGRKDRQIKLRSYRVELDEIEAVLISHEAVQEAAILAIPKDESLTVEGAVLLKDTFEVAEADLRTFVGRYVPSYATPTTIHILRSFPYTSSGKVDYPSLQRQLLTEQY